MGVLIGPYCRPSISWRPRSVRRYSTSAPLRHNQFRLTSVAFDDEIRRKVIGLWKRCCRLRSAVYGNLKPGKQKLLWQTTVPRRAIRVVFHVKPYKGRFTFRLPLLRLWRGDSLFHWSRASHRLHFRGRLPSGALTSNPDSSMPAKINSISCSAGDSRDQTVRSLCSTQCSYRIGAQQSVTDIRPTFRDNVAPLDDFFYRTLAGLLCLALPTIPAASASVDQCHSDVSTPHHRIVGLRSCFTD